MALAGVILLVPLAGASPARAQGRSAIDEAVRQMDVCLKATAAPAAPAVPAKPPGLSRGDTVVASKTPVGAGELYVYQGKAAAEMVCGVAIYGVDGDALASEIRSRLRLRDRGLKPSSESLSPLKAPAGGQATYWGKADAESASGIVFLTRPPELDAPSLEIDFHAPLAR